MGAVRDRPEGLNEGADTEVAVIDPILSALNWELRGLAAVLPTKWDRSKYVTVYIGSSQ